jgi:hypothetical protein
MRKAAAIIAKSERNQHRTRLWIETGDRRAGIGLTMKTMEPKDAISGIITASNWDENDRITAVTLSATDDEEYLIENGDKFIDLVHHFIKATGVIKRQKKAPKTIFIKNYKVLEDSSDDI